MRYLLSFITILILLPSAFAHETDDIRAGGVHATVEQSLEILREVTDPEDQTVTQVPTGMFRLTYRDEDGNVLGVVTGRSKCSDKPQHIHYDGQTAGYWDVLEGEHTHQNVVGYTDTGLPCYSHSHTYIIPWHSHDEGAEYYEPGPDAETLQSVGSAPSLMLDQSSSGSAYNYQRPNVVLTEYMMQASELPQWFEVYNRGEVRVDVQGWKLVVWQQQNRKRTITLQQSVSIPPKGFIVFVNRDLKTDDYSGIDPRRVSLYQLRELGRTRYIWHFQLLDAHGRFIENGNQYQSKHPKDQKGDRHSYDVINRRVVNEDKNAAWIGDPSDQSTLGWHLFAEGAPASTISVRTLTTKWAVLKQ